jgi:hypothetical protein
MRNARFVPHCGDQGNNEIVFNQHLVQIDAKSVSGKLHRAMKKTSDLIGACIIA